MALHVSKLVFSRDEVERYARQILLPEVGGIGQAQLRDASVLIVGVGGLGAPLALYLAAAGIGRIGLIDDDSVALSNLHRQVIYSTSDISRPKVDAAAERLYALNPLIRVDTYHRRATETELTRLLSQYDLVCDGSDTFGSRLAVAKAARVAQRTLISGAVYRFEGQISTFRARVDAPCYQCLYPQLDENSRLSCAETGVLGAVTGVVGTIMAMETIKEILDVGETLSGRLICWDALTAASCSFEIPRDPKCAACKGAS